ncbi:hypothetical protein PZ01_16135 [Lacticaseibacillus rhamnosus]|nr:hypothetical protein PZ01_16135 [Lacticaseibacillus rhamnosus]
MRTISATKSVYDLRYFAVAMITLASVIIYNMYLKKFISLLPILLGIVTGYVVALLFGIVDLTPVQQAAWFDLPKFELPFISYQPQLYWGAILSMAPIGRVAAPDTPFPFGQAENIWLPNAKDIEAKVRETVNF